MPLGGSIRGVRPGVKALRNEREIADDPDREAKLQMYQRRAELEAPLFDPDQVNIEVLSQPAAIRKEQRIPHRTSRRRSPKRR